LLGLTGLALLLTLLEVIDVLTSLDDLGEGASVSAGIGTWLGLLVAIGAVVLAFLTMRAEQAGRVAA
jgi:hypothetical protein